MSSGSARNADNNPIIINGYRRLETGRKLELEDDSVGGETMTPNLPGNM